MIDPVEQQIVETIQANQAGLVDFCRRLIQTPSVNGVDDEVHVAEVIAAEAHNLGLDVQIVAEQPDRPNVIASTSEMGETGLLLIGHLDTVPPGDLANWIYPPFSGEIADGRIYGRGAIDTKGGMAAAIYALAAVKDEISGRAQFIGVPDEESGATGTLGIKTLSALGLLSGKGAIYAYSGSEVILGHRGLLRYRLVCTGQAIHTGAFEWQERISGANAVTGMAHLLRVLELIDENFARSNTPYFERFRTVMTPGTIISGGVSINIVPDRCEALLDIRTTPEADVQHIEALLDQAIAAIKAANPSLKFRYERLNFIPAALSDESAPIFSILADLIPQVRGIPAVKTVAGPANEGYLLIERGIPTVCGFGPTGENAHAANEYVNVEGLVEAALIFALAARRMSKESI